MHLPGALLGARVRAAWVPAQRSLVTFWMHEEALPGLSGVLRPSAGEQPRKRQKMQSQCRKPQRVVCAVSREAKRRQVQGQACVREAQAGVKQSTQQRAEPLEERASGWWSVCLGTR